VAASGAPLDEPLGLALEGSEPPAAVLPEGVPEPPLEPRTLAAVVVVDPDDVVVVVESVGRVVVVEPVGVVVVVEPVGVVVVVPVGAAAVHVTPDPLVAIVICAVQYLSSWVADGGPSVQAMPML
jgi:hypothetical protein